MSDIEKPPEEAKLPTTSEQIELKRIETYQTVQEGWQNIADKVITAIKDYAIFF